MSVRAGKCNPVEIVRGDDCMIPVTIKVKDSAGNYTQYLDYSKYDWSASFRNQPNSPLFYPAIVTISNNRLELLFTKESTKKMRGPGYVDLQSVNKDDGRVRTWVIADVTYEEDATYV